VSAKGTFKQSTYPYTYARVMVMKSGLLKPADYERLAKLSLDGLLKYLNGTDYAREIQRLGIQQAGIRLLELALQENMARAYSKLRVISPPEFGVLFDTHLFRRDIEDIKIILRGVSAGLPRERIRERIYPVNFTEAQYGKLISSSTVEDVLNQLTFIPSSSFADALSRYRSTKSLTMVENVLDRHLYSMMLKRVKALPQHLQVVRGFLLLELDLLNLMAVLKLKEAGLSPEAIRRVILTGEGKIEESLMRQITGADLVPAIRLIKTSLYGALFQHLDEEHPDLAAVEIELERFKLKESTKFLHRQPLTADVILGYLFAKEAEARNLLLLGKASHLGLGSEFVRRNLVV